jgi:hypothetical protein
MVLGLEDLRWGEVVGLPVSDRVSVRGPGSAAGRAVLCSNGGGALYVDTLKNGRARTVPLLAWLLDPPQCWMPCALPDQSCARMGSRTVAGLLPFSLVIKSAGRTHRLDDPQDSEK